MFEKEKFALAAEYDGIYLSCQDQNFEESELYAFLKRYKIDRYDFRAIRKFLIDRKPCKICLRSSDLEKSAKLTVEISKDKMYATVAIEPPFFSKPWPSDYAVKEALAAQGVKFGINDRAIDLMLGSKVDNEAIPPTVVAEGVMPVEGKDGYIEILKDPNKPFEVSDDEKIDFWSRSTIVTVNPGQEIALKHPAKEGKNGIDVKGTVVKAKAVKNVDFSFGDGLSIDKDNKLLLVATTGGQLKNDGGKLVVLPELELHKDIDFAVGSVDFNGAVTIHGSVLDGFNVKSQGNIEIFGNVEGSDIDAQGVLVVHGGVRAMDKGNLCAAGDISLNFVDQATIRSGGTVLANNAILHSNVFAKRAVIALGKGKHSQIAGGHIEAGLEVSCNVLGSEMGTRTEIIVGTPPDILENRKILSNEVKQCKENLEKIEPNLALLKRLEADGQLDDQKRVVMMELTKAKFQLQAELNAKQAELDKLIEQLELYRGKGIVRARDICYPGVMISIRGLSYLVQEPLKYAGFIADDETRSVRLVAFNYMRGELGG